MSGDITAMDEIYIICSHTVMRRSIDEPLRHYPGQALHGSQAEGPIPVLRETVRQDQMLTVGK